METIRYSKEGLLHGGTLDMDKIILEYFPTKGPGIQKLILDANNCGARFHLFGGALMQNLSPNLKITDLRGAAEHFSRPAMTPAIAVSENVLRDTPGDLMNCMQMGLYNHAQLRHIASQLRNDLDTSVEGTTLVRLHQMAQTLKLDATISSAISAPGLELIKINEGHSQISVMSHNNPASYRTSPGGNLDLAYADISTENEKLTATLSQANIKLIGDPPMQRVVGWKNLVDDIERTDLVLSRGLRHTFTMRYKGRCVDTPPGGVEESEFITHWLNNVVTRMLANDPSLTKHRKEIGVALIGRLMSDTGLTATLNSIVW